MKSATMNPGEPGRRTLLTLGNSHVGTEIHCFSIPAFSTCPGATLACLTVCYALGFLFYVKQNLAKHKAHWELALDNPTLFAREMIAEIRYKRVQILRIHVAGDFFSVPYIRAWLRIAKTFKRTAFLFYTLSWRVAEFRPHLIELASLPNVHAFWSEDRDSGACDIPVGRRCFLCVDPADEALVPRGVLVFRDDIGTARKWINGSWVCPKEQGTGAEITCSSCRRCVLPDPFPLPPEERRRASTTPAPGSHV